MRLDIVKPSVWKSTVHLMRDGALLTTLEPNGLRERIAFAVDGKTYDARASKDDGVLVLTDTSTGLPLAQRVKLGAFSSDLDIEAVMPDGAIHVIRIDHISTLKERRVELRVGGVAVGGVERKRTWKTSSIWADLPDHWPVAVSVFIVWLVLRQFAAEDAAAAS